MPEIHKNDIIKFKIRFVDSDSGSVVDVSAATTLMIKFRKPDQTAVQQTATFTTDGSDGYIEYTTDNTDLDQSRMWHIQGFVSGVGLQNSTELGHFEVKKNL